MKLQYKTIRYIAFALPLAMAATNSASAEEFVRGRALYENHCNGCHESWVHNRDERKVSTLNQVRRKVATWSIHSDLDWSNEEIEDVTDYLAREFYRLEPDY